MNLFDFDLLSFTEEHGLLLTLGLFAVFFFINYLSSTRKILLSIHHSAEREERILELQAEMQRDDGAADRKRQREEVERAERLMVQDYVDLLLPRLLKITSLRYLGSRNRNLDELARYRNQAHFMAAQVIDPAHPEKNLAVRIAFLVLQLSAAFRIALDARWVRALTDTQHTFLENWGRRLEPVICSGLYPGEVFLYREQLEMANNIMIRKSNRGLLRPLDWQEFTVELEANEVLREITDLIANQFRLIFDETVPDPKRRAMQCRLAILCLYLYALSDRNGNAARERKETALWQKVGDWFQWEEDAGQNPRWFVFEYGDIKQWILRNADGKSGSYHNGVRAPGRNQRHALAS